MDTKQELEGSLTGTSPVSRGRWALQVMCRGLGEFCGLKFSSCAMSLLMVVLVLTSVTTGAEAGITEGNRAVAAGDYETAYKELLPIAEAGFRQAQDTIAQLYEGGYGVEKDLSRAMFWYRKAAEQEHTRAAFRLGQMHLNGLAGKIDYQEAKRWFLVAYKKFDPEVAYHIALLHDHKSGDMYNPDEAINWYLKSAGKGHAKSQYLLGLAILSRSHEEDEDAITWIRRAAEQKHASANLFLFKRYFWGDRVERDLMAAITYGYHALRYSFGDKTE